MNEKEYLEQLRRHASETVTFYSNPQQQSERERMVVCAFLRCIGIDFSVCEIRSKPENDPVDVEFRDAHFQVTDLLGDRMPGVIWRERERNWRNADSISDVVEPFTVSKPISYDEISKNIAKHLEKKATRYTARTCATVDVLVHVDLLPKRHLWPLDPVSNHHHDLVEHAWRSVSMVSLPYGSVLAACEAAPESLRSRNGRILSEWERSNGWFDLE